MKRFIIVTIILIVSSCASTEEEEIIEPAKLETFRAEVNTEILWKRSIDERKSSQLRLQPVINKGRLFAASNEGIIVAYNLDSGKRLWESDIKLPFSSPLGSDDENLIIGTREGDVLLIKQSDGTVVWQEKVSSEILAKPLLVQNIAVIRAGDGKLFGLNAKNGKPMWTYERKVPALSLRGSGAPIAKGKAVYAGFDNGKLVAFTLQDGKIIWEVTLGVPTGRSELERMVDLDADPIVEHNIIYAVSYQGRIAAIDNQNGRMLWFRELSSYSGMVLDNHNIYVVDAKGHVLALNRDNGSTLWKQDILELRNLTPPTLHGEYVVVGDFDGYLHWLSTVDGRLVSRNRIDDTGISSAPVVVKNTLITRSHSGVLAAIDYRQENKSSKNKYDNEDDDDF